MRDNISCSKCRHRHPADRTCNDAALIADLQGQLRGLRGTISELQQEVAARTQELRANLAVLQIQAAQRREVIAVAALAGLLAKSGAEYFDGAAPAAVRQADALIQELDKR
jgi:hypothetical protein